MALFNSNGTYRKTQKSKLTQKLTLQHVDFQEPYVALVDMGMICRMATPTAEDRQTQDGTPYKWSDYLTDLAQSVDADIIYSVGSNCTNLSTQQPMQKYRFDQSEVDTVLFSAYMQSCACQATVALLSLMLMQMRMSRQRSSHSNCPVRSVSRESRRRSSAETL